VTWTTSVRNWSNRSTGVLEVAARSFGKGELALSSRPKTRPSGAVWVFTAGSRVECCWCCASTSRMTAARSKVCSVLVGGEQCRQPLSRTDQRRAAVARPDVWLYCPENRPNKSNLKLAPTFTVWSLRSMFTFEAATPMTGTAGPVAKVYVSLPRSR
jgi:hypothetical protein